MTNYGKSTSKSCVKSKHLWGKQLLVHKNEWIMKTLMKCIVAVTMLITIASCKKEDSLDSKCRNFEQLASFNAQTNAFYSSTDFTYTASGQVQSSLYSNGYNEKFEYIGNVINLYDPTTNRKTTVYELNAAGYVIKRTSYNTSNLVAGIETFTRNTQNYVVQSVYKGYHANGNVIREVTRDNQVSIYNQNLMRVRTYITDFSFDYLTGVRTLNDDYTQLIEYTYDESQTYFAGFQGYMEVIPTQPTSKNRVKTQKFTSEYPATPSRNSSGTYTYNYEVDKYGRVTKVMYDVQSGANTSKTNVNVKYPC